MRRQTQFQTIVALLSLFVFATGPMAAQGYDSPLTMQGLTHATNHSAGSRGVGGTNILLTDDIAVMFSNPASLSKVTGLRVSIGGIMEDRYTKQYQRYGGLQTHSAFTPLVEGTTWMLSDPDTSLYVGGSKVTWADQTDSVQRPFDSIQPSWDKSEDATLPVQFFAAMPFSVEEISFVVGVGGVEYANMNWYYQNNNCFSPSVLSVLAGTIRTGTLNTNPYTTQWYQYAQRRNGSIYGYGVSLAMMPAENLSVGLSGMYLTGSTDDSEQHIGRGRMVFFASSLRLDKLGMVNDTRTGTSDYSGMEFTFGGTYETKKVKFGLSVKPPTEITRSFTTNIATDTVVAVERFTSRNDSVHSGGSFSLSGEDKMLLPWRGTAALSIALNEKLTVAVEFEVRTYATSVYTDAGGIETKPWKSSSVLHFGAEYQPTSWLRLRGGVQEFAEVFEPLSNALRGETVRYPVYSFGCGLTYGDARLDVTYEYSERRYTDTWSNAASFNREYRNNVVAALQYALPW